MKDYEVVGSADWPPILESQTEEHRSQVRDRFKIALAKLIFTINPQEIVPGAIEREEQKARTRRYLEFPVQEIRRYNFSSGESRHKIVRARRSYPKNT